MLCPNWAPGDVILLDTGAAILQIGDGVTPTAVSLTTGGPFGALFSNDGGSSDALAGLQGIAKQNNTRSGLGNS